MCAMLRAHSRVWRTSRPDCIAQSSDTLFLALHACAQEI